MLPTKFQVSIPVVFVAVILLLSHNSAQAQTNNWTNAGNANWSVASAWSLGVPTSLQDVYHTNTATTITVNTNASAKTLTIGGASGTALFNMNTAGVSLTTGGDITLAPGAGAGTFQLGNSNITVSINGGAGSIINGGGAGLASLVVQSGFSNSLGLLNASVDDLNMAQGGTATLIITNGQTYTVANLLRLNNASTVAGSTGTILMNGGTLNFFGQEIRFNSGTNTANQSYLILNSNAVVTASTIQRQNLGTDAAIQWNDGTIGNYAGTNLVIQANGTTNGTMNMQLAGTGVHTFNASSTNAITVAATAQLQDKTGEAGTLVKAGTGVLILAGSNSYTGGTTLNAGTIRVNHDNGLGTGGLTLNGGTLASTNARTLANNVTVGGAVALGESATGTGALTFNGTVNLGSGNTVTINRASTFANAVSGTGTFSVATNGSVVVTGSGSMTTGTAINLTTNGTSFDISGVSGSGVTVGSVASAASSTVALGSKALTLGGDNTSTTLAGTVTGATGGSLVKNGSGTLTLVVSNSHTGGVTLNAGALALSNNFALGTGALTINGGSVGSAGGSRTLANNLVLNTNLTVNAGGAFSISGNVDLAGGTRVINQNGVNATYSGVISNGGLTISNGSSGIDTFLSGANTYNGATTVRQGILNLSGSGSLSNSAVNLTGGAASTLSIAGVTTSTEIGSLAGNANSKVDLGAKTLIVGRDNTSTTFAGLMSNTGSLIKTGSGTMILSGSNSYIGGTTLGAGSLRLDSTNAAGSGTITQTDGSSTLQINVAGTIANTMSLWKVAYLQGANLSGALTLNNTVFDVTNNVTATNSGTLSGTGGVDKIGAGTLVLSGSNSYQGGTSISNGAVSISADNNLGAVPGTAQAGNITLDGGKLLITAGLALDANRGLALGSGNGIIEVAAAQTVTYGGIAAGSGSLTKSGNGTLTLSGANTYSGGTTIAAGTLSGNSTSLQGNITNSSALVFDQTSAGTYAGVMSGAGSFTKSGSGSLTLSGASTATGAVTVSAGTLNLGNTTGAALGSITSLSVAATNAVLLVSQSNQVNDTAAITLSGGTITRGGNVSEVFGNLNVSAASFLDFGAANAAGTLSFATYTASALLTVQNFLPGNKLQFATGFDSTLLPTGGNLSNANFSFSNGFTTGTEGGYFTITAIPEPSTYLAASGLLALFLWPLRRRTSRAAQ